METEQIELCTVRWSSAFLSTILGKFWPPTGNAIDKANVFEKCGKSLKFLLLVTFQMDGSKRMFKAVNWENNGPYNTGFGLNLVESTQKSLQDPKPESDSTIVDCRRGTKRQKNFHPMIEHIWAINYAQCMGVDNFDALIKYSSALFMPKNDFGWDLLLWQNRENDVQVSSIPPFPWGHLMVPLWDTETNWRVLQATVHVDNSICANTYRVLIQGSDSRNPFEFATQKTYDQRNYPEPYFSGCIVEMVRTFLAGWLSKDRNPAAVNWMPLLPKTKVEFDTNEKLKFDDKKG